MSDKFYMVIRETGGSAPNKRHMMEDEAIKEASRLATQTQERYFVLATIGVVAPVVAPVLYTEI